MHMRYQHIGKTERLELAVLLKKGYSLRSIAEAMGRSPSSVSREIAKRSVKGRYDPEKAHHKAYVKRKYSKYQGMKIREHPALERFVRRKLERSWSPDRIAGRWERLHPRSITITAKGIYKYVGSSFGAGLKPCLPRKGRKPRRIRQAHPAIIQNRVFIDERPEVINQRERFGDFEGDTMGRAKSASSETLVVARERMSRYLLATKVPRLRYAIEGFHALLCPLPASSVTLDNGVENARYEELGVETYFCHPYSSWEKGSVEQGIGLIRRSIPKRADLARYSPERIRAIVKAINDTPMRCLDYRTPKEVFEEQLALTTLPTCCT